MKHADIAGHDIKPGDIVVYAALWGRSPTLRYGRVTRLAERDETWRSNGKIPTIRVRSVDRNWKDEWELQKKGGEVTLGLLDRLLVVPEDLVPPQVLVLLDRRLWPEKNE